MSTASIYAARRATQARNGHHGNAHANSTSRTGPQRSEEKQARIREIQAAIRQEAEKLRAEARARRDAEKAAENAKWEQAAREIREARETRRLPDVSGVKDHPGTDLEYGG